MEMKRWLPSLSSLVWLARSLAFFFPALSPLPSTRPARATRGNMNIYTPAGWVTATVAQKGQLSTLQRELIQGVTSIRHINQIEILDQPTHTFYVWNRETKVWETAEPYQLWAITFWRRILMSFYQKKLPGKSVLSTAQGRAEYIKSLISQLMSQNPGMSRREARRQAVVYLDEACQMVKTQGRQMRRLEREQALFEGTAPDVIGTKPRQPVHVGCRAKAAARRDTRATYGAPCDTKRKARVESGPAVIVRRKAG